MLNEVIFYAQLSTKNPLRIKSSESAHSLTRFVFTSQNVVSFSINPRSSFYIIKLCFFLHFSERSPFITFFFFLVWSLFYFYTMQFYFRFILILFLKESCFFSIHPCSFSFLQHHFFLDWSLFFSCSSSTKHHFFHNSHAFLFLSILIIFLHFVSFYIF